MGAVVWTDQVHGCRVLDVGTAPVAGPRRSSSVPSCARARATPWCRTSRGSPCACSRRTAAPWRWPVPKGCTRRCTSAGGVCWPAWSRRPSTGCGAGAPPRSWAPWGRASMPSATSSPVPTSMPWPPSTAMRCAVGRPAAVRRSTSRPGSPPPWRPPGARSVRRRRRLHGVRRRVPLPPGPARHRAAGPAGVVGPGGRVGTVTGPADTFPGFADRLARIRARIDAAAPDPERVTLLAVTKGFGPESGAHGRGRGTRGGGGELRRRAGGQGRSGGRRPRPGSRVALPRRDPAQQGGPARSGGGVLAGGGPRRGGTGHRPAPSRGPGAGPGGRGRSGGQGGRPGDRGARAGRVAAVRGPGGRRADGRRPAGSARGGPCRVPGGPPPGGRAWTSGSGPWG